MNLSQDIRALFRPAQQSLARRHDARLVARFRRMVLEERQHLKTVGIGTTVSEAAPPRLKLTVQTRQGGHHTLDVTRWAQQSPMLRPGSEGLIQTDLGIRAAWQKVIQQATTALAAQIVFQALNPKTPQLGRALARAGHRPTPIY